MLLWLIPIFPLLGFLANGIFGRRIPKALINTIAVGSVALSFAWVVKTLLALDPIETKYRWTPLKPSTWSTTTRGFKAER
jgi:NADH-quinone oxidoreductase subunit L